MPLKRRPFIVDGEAIEIDAPGLKVVRGVDLYWCASETVAGRLALSRGYQPATARIYPTSELNTTTRGGLGTTGAPPVIRPLQHLKRTTS